MSSDLPPPPEGLDPTWFANLGASFMAAKLLFVGVELGIFEHLADGPLGLDALGAATGVPNHSLRVVANGLVAIDVLQLRAERYSNSDAAQAFLTGRTSVDVRPGLRLFDKVVYPMWNQFENTVRTGAPARHEQTSASFARIFSEGVAAWTRMAAIALPEHYDFGRHERLLDIGGGTGSYIVPILERHPAMEATLFELPPSAEVARHRLEREPTQSRIVVLEGDMLFDRLPEGHDVVLLAAILHLFDREKIFVILDRVRRCVTKGATLLIVDNWMNPAGTEPALGALLAGTYLLFSGHARTYSVEEVKPWLAQTGWRFASHRPIAAENSLVVAEAI